MSAILKLISSCSVAVGMYYLGYHLGRKSVGKEESHYSDVYFFSNVIKCGNHLFDKDPCGSPVCMYTFVENIKQHLRRAKKSLDVCMYIMTFGEITDVLIECFQRGVQVRIITDIEMKSSLSSKVDDLKKRGIEIRTQKSDFIMHHKFVVIDKTLLLSGSFNWTMQAVIGNEDNVIVTTDKCLVLKFSSQFENLWKNFKT